MKLSFSLVFGFLLVLVAPSAAAPWSPSHARPWHGPSLPSDVRVLGKATEDINAMEHDVKQLLGGTIDTAFCLLLLPLCAPFACLFLAGLDTDTKGYASEYSKYPFELEEEASLLHGDTEEAEATAAR